MSAALSSKPGKLLNYRELVSACSRPLFKMIEEHLLKYLG